MQPMEMADGQTVDAVMEGEVRNGFIKKVYGILTVQLLLTFAIAFPIQQADQTWVQSHYKYCQIAIFVSLAVTMGVMCCCHEAARRFPTNYLFLFVVTVCESVVVGFISAMYTTQSVMIAVILTAGIFVGLSIYAVTTKTDFTGMGGYLVAALLGLCLTSFVCMFFPSPMMNTLMGGAGAIIFSCYIVYDTQLICGGKHNKFRFTVDDYVFAALNIYFDIVNLFIYLLELFGDRRG